MAHKEVKSNRPSATKPAPVKVHQEDARREAEASAPDEDGHERQDAPVLSSEKPHRDQSEAV